MARANSSDGASTVARLQLGGRLRALRKQRQLTLRVLAERTGLSQGFLSQAERGLVSPSIASLQRIAEALDAQIAFFFDDDHHSRPAVLRLDERTPLLFDQERVRKFLLTPRPLEHLEVLLCELQPGGSTSQELYSHGASEEFVLVVSGRAEIEVAGKLRTLDAGDCMTYASAMPHRATNPGPEVAELLFAISPPSF